MYVAPGSPERKSATYIAHWEFLFTVQGRFYYVYQSVANCRNCIGHAVATYIYFYCYS